MLRIMLFSATLVSLGCSSLTPTENGVLGGGALGGVAGALIGNATGNTAAGAAIGTGIGAIAGGLTGNAVEQAEHKAVARAERQQAAARQLGMTDVVQMSQSKVSDAVIIGQIRTTNSTYQLSPTDIQWLKENGVSDNVVLEMQQTSTRARPVVYGRPRPIYVYEEPVFIGPPPVVGFGVSYGHGRRW
jgi:uncharacterized protein YcfJ